MTKLLLAIPVLIDNESRLTECLTGAFNQDMVKNGDADVLVIINHKEDGTLLAQAEKFEDSFVIINEFNFGVSGSWNQAIIEAEENGYKYVACCGFDTVMSDSTLLTSAVKEMKEANAHFGKGSTMSFNFWMMDVDRCPTVVGKFDENFYPGYWEDYDYMRRLRMLRDKGLITEINFDDEKKIAHAQSRTVNDHETIIPHDVWNYSYTKNQLYLRQKWGTDEDNYKLGFEYPFNDKRLHTSFWIQNITEMQKSRDKWEECLRRNVRG